MVLFIEELGLKGRAAIITSSLKGGWTRTFSHPYRAFSISAIGTIATFAGSSSSSPVSSEPLSSSACGEGSSTLMLISASSCAGVWLESTLSIVDRASTWKLLERMRLPMM